MDEAPTEGAGTRDRRADAERNREAIVRAAVRLIAQDPHAALDDIARAAGVTRTTLYRHYPSRDALVRETYHRALEGVERAVAAARLEQGPLSAAFQRAVDAVIGTADEYAVLVNGPAVDLGDPTLGRRYDAALAPVVALAERGQQEGELSRDVPAWWVADALVGLLLTALTRVLEDRLDVSEVPGLVIATFWNGVVKLP